MEKIALLTGGGDCPGLNAVIRAIVRRSLAHGYEVLGVRQGWRGMLENHTEPLTLDAVSGILHVGGTILGTSRTNPLKIDGGKEQVWQTFRGHRLRALIAIGGEDTLGVATVFAADGMPIVGVPKTIDNDLSGTDLSFGFDTAVSIATEAIDRLHTTAEAHNRVMVVEVMGRHAGWIATTAGLAGGADVILIPEIPADLDQVCALIRRRHERGKSFSIVVVAEGTKLVFRPGEAETTVRASARVDAFGHEQLGGVGVVLAREIEARTGYETRVTVLGHVQRGGSPTAFDRVLATRFGVFATDMVREGRVGMMAALQGTEIVAVPLAEATGKLKTVDMRLYEIARVFFG